MQEQELWQSVLGDLEVQISRPNFLTWLKNSRLIDSKEGVVVVALPNNFAKEWVENKYNKLILGSLRTFNETIKRVEFIVEGSLIKIPKPKKLIPSLSLEKQLTFSELKIDPQTNLNPRYTLNSFVVGSANELAYAAGQAIIEKIGHRYNPLFVYGGTGLGKTHLIQAVGNEIKNVYKDGVRVKYVSSEKFTNDVVWAIRNKRMDDLKNNYRQLDVLIVDDIQFIGGKEKTEEEFFHIFNTLYQDNKQVVISSDRPPKAIPILEERLRSRFEGGMITDITYPDYEMRFAIIKTKLQERNCALPDEVIDIVAKKVQRNVREIEGILNKLIFYQSTYSNNFNFKAVEKIINETVDRVASNVNPNQVIKAVASFFEISPTDLIGRGRKKEIVEPRQIAIYLLRDMLKMSYPYIAEKIGKRDHTTAIYAYEKINNSIDKDPNLNQKILMIKELVYKSE
ncbi:MAG: hypothetical protein A3H06_01985 [Candidatus Colwellbacteria bacterium RIFCSPLOWO2_12_FULL_44_13]|uniref:Chromosomal replication initiator protein DnaA n=3 Tax=Candidatus Colwelliibacteriota TaxID=1817904 RepID=A0A1G1Z4N3_9BACT|nr:MAG: hypothetical protein A3F24_02705 [Candidatus Colwellbacteria bacterium RIFCSPHIGHO2_12_FULL_44_17]OGY59484.1 MAG: hypothetical protein A3I31_03120 [Candidatus Colwellbacteria bacterium RIFCSPLOWO2_02_FULL_44_20b]OGY61484.1 MAG: hypothetical protein A3H06_01985 [Candidatus Colwellbacteria bacterium RIFCSPLOWO2_12_FULL_44_13]